MIHAMSLDASYAVYATEFINFHETGNTSIADTIDTTAATANGEVSQTNVDSQVASLQSKDIAYNNTVTSYIINRYKRIGHSNVYS